MPEPRRILPLPQPFFVQTAAAAAMRFPLALLLLVPLVAGCAVDDEPHIDDVTLTTVPDSASAGEEVEVCWQVDGAGDIGHVAMHWGPESHSGNGTQFGDYPEIAWPDGEQADRYSLPGEFCAPFTMPDSDVYLRGHAMIDAPGVLSEEARITRSLL